MASPVEGLECFAAMDPLWLRRQIVDFENVSTLRRVRYIEEEPWHWKLDESKIFSQAAGS
jgi:hypothetical protein